MPHHDTTIQKNVHVWRSIKTAYLALRLPTPEECEVELMLGLFTFGRGQKRGRDDVVDIISFVAGYVSIPFVTSQRFDA